MTGRELEIPATITIQLGPKPQTVRRTLVFRRSASGDALRYAVRGYMQGRLDLGGKKYAALLVDGNADGCFDTVGQDRVWIDLNENGHFDPLTEQFPLGKPITHGGEVYVVRSDASASAVVANRRNAGQAKLRLTLAKKLAAPAKLSAELVSDLGELVVVNKLDEAIAVPDGDYRLSSLKVTVPDSSGQTWTYDFFNESAKNYAVPANRETAIVLLGRLTMNVSLQLESGKAAPGQTISIQPKLLADGSLYLSSCTVGTEPDSRQAAGNAEVLLLRARRQSGQSRPDGLLVRRLLLALVSSAQRRQRQVSGPDFLRHGAPGRQSVGREAIRSRPMMCRALAFASRAGRLVEEGPGRPGTAFHPPSPPVKTMPRYLVAAATICCWSALVAAPGRCAAADPTAPPAWFKDAAAKLPARAGRQVRPGLPGPAAARTEATGPVLAGRGRRRRRLRILRARELRRRPGRAGRHVRPLRAMLEKIDGHMSENCATSSASRPTSTAVPSCRWTSFLPATSRRPTLIDDLFANKLAFVVLLNFPLTTLQERAGRRREMDAPPMGRSPAGAAVRHPRARRSLAGRLPERVATPGSTSASTASACTICWTPDGRRPFPAKMRLHRPLEPPRRNQGAVRRRRRRAGPAAHDRASARTHRRPIDPASGDRQPAGGLGPGDATRCGPRPSTIWASRRRPISSPPPRPSRTPVTPRCWPSSAPTSGSIPIARWRRR